MWKDVEFYIMKLYFEEGPPLIEVLLTGVGESGKYVFRLFNYFNEMWTWYRSPTLDKEDNDDNVGEGGIMMTM